MTPERLQELERCSSWSDSDMQEMVAALRRAWAERDALIIECGESRLDGYREAIDDAAKVADEIRPHSESIIGPLHAIGFGQAVECIVAAIRKLKENHDDSADTDDATP